MDCERGASEKLSYVGELSIARTITVVVESAAERWLNATYFAVKRSEP